MCSYDGPLLEEKTLLTAAEGGLSSPEYVALCIWLTSRLKPLCDLEENNTSGAGKPQACKPNFNSLNIKCTSQRGMEEVHSVALTGLNSGSS